jgi:hypothetical protein
MRYAVLVTGDRFGTYDEWKDAIPAALPTPSSGLTMIHGDQGDGSTGIDTVVANVMEPYLVTKIPMPAQWLKYGKMAGPIRNREMVRVLRSLREVGYNTSVFAFHNNLWSSRGTRDTVIKALREGFDVFNVSSSGTVVRIEEEPHDHN